MGLSSSQARLLTLTGRMHDIERKAQKIQADKLRLANDSRRAYDNYLIALDSKKLQYSAIMQDGSIGYNDATLAALENGVVPSYSGVTSAKTFLLQNAQNGEIFITPEFAAQYGISDSGDLEPVGTLDEYLDAHNANSTEIIEHPINYNDVQSATPVENVKVSEPYTPADTYTINANSISTPTTTDYIPETLYNVSDAITKPSISSNVPNIDVVNGGSPISFPTPTPVNGALNVTDTTWTFPTGQTYRDFNYQEIRVPKDDLNMTLQQLSTKYNWNLSFTDTDDDGYALNNLSMYYVGKENGTNNYLQSQSRAKTYSYNANTTLNDMLSWFESNISGISYKSYSEDSSKDYGVLYSYKKGFFFISSDDAWTDSYLGKYLGGTFKQNGNPVVSLYHDWSSTEHQLTKDTKIIDVMYSDLNESMRSGGLDFNGCYLRLQKNGTNLNAQYNGTTNLNDLTFDEYFTYLADNNSDISYTTNAAGDMIFSFDGKMDGFGFSGDINRTIVYNANQTNTTTINVSLDAISENIYLMESILAQTPLDDYNSNHDARITAIKNKLTPAYGTDYRQLALLQDALVAALNSGDNAQIQSVYSNVKSNILDYTNKWNISSEDYIDSTSEPVTTVSGNTTTNTTVTTHYAFAIDSADYSITPGTTQIPDPDPSSVEYTATSDWTVDAIISRLAYDMWNQHHPIGSPDDLKTDLISRFNSYGYTDEDIISISNHVENPSDWSNIILKLMTHQRIDAYTRDFDTFVAVNPGTNNITITPYLDGVEEHYVTMDSENDIACKLAADIYAGNSALNPIDIKDQILATFNTKQLAGLSSYYGTSEWNAIVSALSSGVNASAVSAYTNKYSSYNDFRPNSANDNSIVPVNHDLVKGKVNIPTLEGIASNIVVAFRKAGYTVEQSEVLSLLSNKYSADDLDNNEKLASINDAVCKYLKGAENASQVQNIYNHLYGSATLNVPTVYNKTNYNFDRVNNGACQAEYGTTEFHTGKYEWVKDDYYYQLVNEYNTLKSLEGYRFKVVDTDTAESTEFVNNYIESNLGVFIEFSAGAEIKDMKQTSVAIETSLREVEDDKDLRKAEAQYEADMRKIDKKDRQYDVELAKYDNERNAIKSEMETLKNVAKDNVERTFKLFG